jgi:nitroreductase
MNFNDFEALVRRNRSFRRFEQNKPIETETLKMLINLARLSPSAANLQPLRYVAVNNDSQKNALFPTLSWAGYIQDWDGPEEGEKPVAYLIMLGDTAISDYLEYDAGIAAQSILLGARNQDLAGCILGALNREQIREEFSIPTEMQIMMVIALGKPAEKVVIDEDNTDPVTYYRDENDTHHVPKRPLDELIVDYT